MSAEEVQRQNSKLREISLMAERFGCTSSQLAIAWTLKNEHVHSVLIGAISPEQLYEHLQALQVIFHLKFLLNVRSDPNNIHELSESNTN
jgi:aryl-alcohol dehydrogenase-like predicted oxidoreductase